MSSKVIALSGNMGSGKDTAAAMILKEHQGALSYAFADHLKKIALDLFSCSLEEVYGEEKEKIWDTPKVFDYDMAKEIHVWVSGRNLAYSSTTYLKKAQELVHGGNLLFSSSRALQQFLGTELLRDCYSKDYHINQVAKRIEDDRPDIAVITDARFLNEREWAKSYGAKTVLISGRTRDDFKKDNFSKHASETGLGLPGDYDYEIDNSGTFGYLKSRILEIVQDL